MITIKSVLRESLVTINFFFFAFLLFSSSSVNQTSTNSRIPIFVAGSRTHPAPVPVWCCVDTGTHVSDQLLSSVLFPSSEVW